MSPPQNRVGPLDLPTELRLEVYDNLVLPGRYYGVTKPKLNTWRDFQTLTQLSSKIRAETLPLFLGNMEFKIQVKCRRDLIRAVRWVALLDDTQTSLMRRVVIEDGRFSIDLSVQQLRDGSKELRRQYEDRLAWLEPASYRFWHLDDIQDLGTAGLRVDYLASILIIVFESSMTSEEFDPEQQRQALTRMTS